MDKPRHNEDVYLINGEEYIVTVDTTDDICEAKLVNKVTGETFISRCGDFIKDAMDELEYAVAELKISPFENNVIVFWKDLTAKEQKKIMSKLRTIKSEAISEWDTMEGHYQRWRRMASCQVFQMKDRVIDIETIYPSLLTYAEYSKL